MRNCSKKNKSWKFDWVKIGSNPTRFHNTGWDYFRKVSVHGRRERLNKYGICIGFKVSDKTNNRLYTLSCIRQYQDELNKNGYFELDGKWNEFDKRVDYPDNYLPKGHIFPFSERELTESSLKYTLKSLAYYNLEYQDNKMVYVKRAKKTNWG